jgi:hypothetical protein
VTSALPVQITEPLASRARPPAIPRIEEGGKGRKESLFSMSRTICPCHRQDFRRATVRLGEKNAKRSYLTEISFLKFFLRQKVEKNQFYWIKSKIMVFCQVCIKLGFV